MVGEGKTSIMNVFARRQTTLVGASRIESVGSGQVVRPRRGDDPTPAEDDPASSDVFQLHTVGLAGIEPATSALSGSSPGVGEEQLVPVPLVAGKSR